MANQTDLGLGKLVERGKDIFLSHTGVDKPWVEALAERIEAVRYGERYLGVVVDKWDFDKGKNIVLDIDRTIDECRFIGLAVSKAMLQAEWPTLEGRLPCGRTLQAVRDAFSCCCWKTSTFRRAFVSGTASIFATPASSGRAFRNLSES
jgi:TIR domain-containing protein